MVLQRISSLLAHSALALSASVFLLGCDAGPEEKPVHHTGNDPYSVKVQPILEKRCFRCHAGMNHRGALRMDSRAYLLKGGHHGPALVPGDPEASLMIKLVRHQGPPEDPMPMPDKGEKIPDSEIQTLAEWIKAGAVIPD